MAANILCPTMKGNKRDMRIDRFCATKGTQWNFTPQFAPWAGGTYERLIGIMKRAMRHAFGKKIVGAEEFITVTKEICGTLNRRPLTYVFNENDSLILRPIDLIQPISNDAEEFLVEEMSDDEEYTASRQDDKEKLVALWRKSAKILNRFWSAFRRDYLMSLRERRQRYLKQKKFVDIEPKIDDVVLIEYENVPRGRWKYGVITKLYQSSDGQTRSVQLRNSKGNYLNRPVARLYPLEIGENEHEENPQSAPGSIDEQRPVEQPAETEAGHHPEKNCVTNEPSKNTQAQAQPTERYNLRPRMPVKYQFFIALLCLVMPICSALGGNAKAKPTQTTLVGPNPFMGHRCGDNVEGMRLIASHGCVDAGYLLFNDRGHICYQHKQCPRGTHLRKLKPPQKPKKDICGPKCPCPEVKLLDSHDCSHYKGSSVYNESTIANPKVNEVLRYLRPEICAYDLTPECTAMDVKQIFEIELYDGTTHFVNALTLHHVDFDERDVQCTLGNNATERVTGTDAYCQNFECHKEALNFCWTPHTGKVLLSSPVGKIPIRSWGIRYGTWTYKSDPKLPVHQAKEAARYVISCETYGASIVSNAPLNNLEVCSGYKCVRFRQENDFGENDKEKHHLNLTMM
ncbi:Integrase core domain containing protein [Aphelenchoides avenae]|nr:Integrase core domain containing protein [Aphelenchus avenae]